MAGRGRRPRRPRPDRRPRADRQGRGGAAGPCRRAPSCASAPRSATSCRSARPSSSSSPTRAPRSAAPPSAAARRPPRRFGAATARHGHRCGARTCGERAEAAARPLAAPPVRKLAKELGVDLAAVDGTGPGGRVTAADVRVGRGRSSRPAPAAARRASGDGAQPGRRVARGPAHLVVRRGRRPPAARRARRRCAPATDRVTLTALLVRAAVVALDAFPILNSSLDVDRDELVFHGAVHMGVAVASDRRTRGARRARRARARRARPRSRGRSGSPRPGAPATSRRRCCGARRSRSRTSAPRVGASPLRSSARRRSRSSASARCGCVRVVDGSSADVAGVDRSSPRPRCRCRCRPTTASSTGATRRASSNASSRRCATRHDSTRTSTGTDRPDRRIRGDRAVGWALRERGACAWPSGTTPPRSTSKPSSRSRRRARSRSGLDSSNDSASRRPRCRRRSTASSTTATRSCSTTAASASPTKGREIATSIVRRHRLAERLLVDVIGLEWEKVHKEADRWEHAISADVEEKLVLLLGDPATCPHGNPIPGSYAQGRGPGVGAAHAAAARPGDRAPHQREGRDRRRRDRLPRRRRAHPRFQRGGGQHQHRGRAGHERRGRADRPPQARPARLRHPRLQFGPA